MKFLLFTLAVLLISISIAFAGDNQGAEELYLDGGTKGNIDFPHKLHQETLGDCSLCHSIFPMKKDSIKEMKTQGQLKQRTVMNKLCIKCHKDMKKVGKASGPLSCNKCHQP